MQPAELLNFLVQRVLDIRRDAAGKVNCGRLLQELNEYPVAAWQDAKAWLESRIEETSGYESIALAQLQPARPSHQGLQQLLVVRNAATLRVLCEIRGGAISVEELCVYIDEACMENVRGKAEAILEQRIGARISQLQSVLLETVGDLKRALWQAQTASSADVTNDADADDDEGLEEKLQKMVRSCGKALEL